MEKKEWLKGIKTVLISLPLFTTACSNQPPQEGEIQISEPTAYNIENLGAEIVDLEENKQNPLAQYKDYLYSIMEINYENCIYKTEDEEIIYFWEILFINHTTKKGETPESIIKKYLMTEKQFYELNSDCKKYLLTSELPEGKTLKVCTCYPQKIYKSDLKLNWITYEVKNNNTLIELSRLYDVDIEILKRNNKRIKNPNHIEPGWILNIPDKQIVTEYNTEKNDKIYVYK